MKRRLLSCLSALGLTVCSLSAVSSNAYYWGEFDASSEGESASFYNMVESFVKFDDSGMLIQAPYTGEIEECYLNPDSNTFVIKTSEEEEMRVVLSDEGNAEVVKAVIEKYNADNGTNLRFESGSGICVISFYDVLSPDAAARELKSLIEEKQVAEQIVYYPNIKGWSTGFYEKDSILTYRLDRSDIDDLKVIEEYFIENEIDYRYDNEKSIIGGENLSKAEQMEIAVDIYKTTGARIVHFYLMESNPSFSEGSIDMLNAMYGDANTDEELGVADVVTIMQSIADPDNNKLTAQGRYNADITGDGDGITAEDALAVKKKLIGLG
jgi:hypothetical protein rflaF_03992